MNVLKGIITGKSVSENLALVDVDVSGVRFTALLIDSIEDESEITVGDRVRVLFKETEVAIASGLSGKISLRNRMDCQLNEIIKGKILTRLLLDYNGNPLEAVVTTRSSEMMGLKQGMELQVLVKATEIILQKIYDISTGEL